MYAFSHILLYYRNMLRVACDSDATWRNVDWYTHASYVPANFYKG